jgi:hypothetical protein
MKFLRTFETYKKYTSDKPYSFDSVFKITEQELNDYLSYMIDEFDYIDFDIISDELKKFDIEIYSDDETEDLKSEFEWYKKEVSEDFKTQLLQAHSLKITSEKLDEERNRIIISIEPEIKVKETK